jgi:hypothetical protein
LPRIVKAWYTFVRTPKEMTPHTILPTVSVVRQKDLPSWLPGLPKEGEEFGADGSAPKAPVVADPAASTPAPAAEPVKRALDMTSGASPLRAPQPQPAAPSAGISSAAKQPMAPAPAPAAKAATAAAEADELLGLDF